MDNMFSPKPIGCGKNLVKHGDMYNGLLPRGICEDSENTPSHVLGYLCAKCLVQLLWDSKIRGQRAFDRRFTRGGAESTLV